MEAASTVAPLPATLEAAFDAADADNPALARSRETARASEAAVRLARADYGPDVVLQGALGYVGAVAPFAARDYDRDVSAAVVLTQPILTGGLVASQVRQARDQAASDRLSVETVRRQVVRDVAQAWSAVLSAQAETKASASQVEAAQLALTGAQAEYAYALRTTLDVLIADQTLRSAQLALAQSGRDALLAQSALLMSTGQLRAEPLP